MGIQFRHSQSFGCMRLQGVGSYARRRGASTRAVRRTPPTDGIARRSFRARQPLGGLADGQAAVDVQLLSGDVFARAAAKQQRRAGDVFGLADATDGIILPGAAAARGGAEPLAVAPRVKITR